MSNLVDGQLGVVGEYKVALVDGKLVASLELSPKVILDSLAHKIGGPVPEQIATFIETAFGLK